MHGPGNRAVTTSVLEQKIRPPLKLRLPGHQDLGRLGTFTATVSLCTASMLLWTASYVEWKVATHAASPGALPHSAVLLASAMPVAAIVLLAAAARVVLVSMIRSHRGPLPVLASRARQIAAGGRVPIPYQDREIEVGDLARALREWQEAAVVREVLLRNAPVGICQLDATGVVLSTNQATRAILGYQPEELEGRNLLDLLHPDDRGLIDRVRQALAAPGGERATVEVRLSCGDGSWLWCSAVIAPVAGEGPAPDGLIVILEDISERKRQAERAAAVQRERLPTRPPPLAGYELAGRCQAAQEEAGDLYDWVDTGVGHLVLTVADVMGKGMGAALVMAALRTALRAAPGELGPAQRVARAEASMTFGAETEGLFVTLFHARLVLATGRLRYVDAGHGYCLIRRAGGEVERLGQRSMPLGLGMGEVFKEGVARLEAGDLLLLCSDGLVEMDERPVALEELVVGLEPAAGAAEMLDRLLARVSGPLADDVTAVVLRRSQLGVLPSEGEERRQATPTAAMQAPSTR